MELNKSSRHSKITGDFAERLILYWLSKYGFECAYVDHVGMDIIAKNPHNNDLMGISVKARSRNAGKENDYVSILHADVEKLEKACQHFNCIPYFAITVDAANTIHTFILSADRLKRMKSEKNKTKIPWRMAVKNIIEYEKDQEIKAFRFSTKTHNWWETNPPIDKKNKKLRTKK